MKVLTFGWDFPPARNGGLGVACFGLTRELAREGVEVIFVLPKSQSVVGTPRFLFADTERLVRVREVPSAVQPYVPSGTMVELYDETGKRRLYKRRLVEEVHAFAHRAASIALEEEHDIIHAHDWTSYLAGVAAKKASGKPLVLHVHATSFDQAASDNVDPEIFQIEKESFDFADSVVAISDYTKNVVVNKHGTDPNKVVTIHNGSDAFVSPEQEPTLRELKEQGKRIVLYHGRITIQKGVDYFVKAARRVIDFDPNVVFVISGWGDMQNQIIDQVGALGLSKHFIFAGSLWEEERDQMYQTADLVVMPSVSEPFGLVPFEALQQSTPSLISKQSGIGEVLSHVLKVDFWDVDEMANKIISTLRYEAMRQQLIKEGKTQMNHFSWQRAAQKIVGLYRNLLQYITS
ncbi:MAG: glycosyltransferase family 4 protein [Patescibacteria group bacterium]